MMNPKKEIRDMVQQLKDSKMSKEEIQLVVLLKIASSSETVTARKLMIQALREELEK